LICKWKILKIKYEALANERITEVFVQKCSITSVIY